MFFSAIHRILPLSFIFINSLLPTIYNSNFLLFISCIFLSFFFVSFFFIILSLFFSIFLYFFFIIFILCSFPLFIEYYLFHLYSLIHDYLPYITQIFRLLLPL